MASLLLADQGYYPYYTVERPELKPKPDHKKRAKIKAARKQNRKNRNKK